MNIASNHHPLGSALGDKRHYDFMIESASMIYINKMFDHLRLQSIGIWIHHHNFTNTSIGPDFGKSAKLKGQHWVKKASHLHF